MDIKNKEEKRRCIATRRNLESCGTLLRLVGVAPAVNTAAVLPPAVTATAAAFRTSAQEAWVVIPAPLATVGSGRLDAVPIGLAVPPLVVAASPT
jgi:hypothetical protein